MGDMADGYIDMAMGLDDFGYHEPHDYQYYYDRDVWPTQIGGIKFKDMDMNHLRNCIRWINERGKTCFDGYGFLFRDKLNKEIEEREIARAIRTLKRTSHQGRT